jgi:LCP family protein required for cell wall assembly
MGRRRRKQGLNFMQILVIIVAIVFWVVIAKNAMAKWNEAQTPTDSTSQSEEPITQGGKEYVLKDNIETILIMGLDKYEQAEEDATGYYNDKQSDFMTLIIIDHETKSYESLHIDRDTMADINVLGLAGQKVGTVNKQIALAHTYGNGRAISARNAMDAVSGLLMDIKIDHYISMTMSAVPVLNDLVDGVTLKVLEDLTSIDPTFIKDAEITLTGEQALKYIQVRYGLENPTNEGRMERQNQFIDAFMETVKEEAVADDTFAAKMTEAVAEYIQSDLSLTKLQDTFDLLAEYATSESLKLDGEHKVNDKTELVEFKANETKLKELVLNLFYEEKAE